jgi:hypothetical protein
VNRDATLQECIDFVLPRVAQLRNERGPNDPVVRRLAKCLAALMEKAPRGSRAHAGQKRYRGVSVGGDPVDVWYDPANVREEER